MYPYCSSGSQWIDIIVIAADTSISSTCVKPYDNTQETTLIINWCSPVVGPESMLLAAEYSCNELTVCRPSLSSYVSVALVLCSRSLLIFLLAVAIFSI